MRVIDLNADLGEDPDRLDRDEALLAIVSSASIACGGHAGDDRTIDAMLSAAARVSTSIGAHPSYPDRDNFGRVEIAVTPEDVRRFVRDQVARLVRAADRHGITLRHVKPHGALYHAAERADVALAIARGAAEAASDLALFGLAGSAAIDHWRNAGYEAWPEGFCDRRIEHGRLVPRSRPDALILDPAEAAANAIDLANSRRIVTLGLHSDTPRALEIAREVRAALEGSGFTIKAPRP